MAIIILICIFIVLVVITVKPKLGIVLLWPMLFLYPHYLMFKSQALPLNIGIDDLFICLIFLIVLVRRNLFGGIPIKFGFAFWVTFAFFIILLVSNLYSYSLVGVEFEIFIKAILKGIITILLAYSLVNSIDDQKDLKRVIFAFCFSAGLGAIIMIFQQFFPGPFSIFASPYYVYGLEYGANPAPAGAFMNQNNAAVILAMASLIILCTLKIKSIYFRKDFRFIFLGIMVIAILFTRSRSGFLCLVIPLMMMGFMGQNKGYTIGFMVLGLIIFIALPAFRSALFERFTGSETETYNVGFFEPIMMRLSVVAKMWKNITLGRLLLGQSNVVDRMRELGTAHNAYFGIPLNYGIGGTVWIISIVSILLHKANIMKKQPDIVISSVGFLIRWCLLIFALYSVVGTFLGNFYIRYSLFLLTALAQCGVELSQQYQSCEYEQYYIEDTDLFSSGKEYLNSNFSEYDFY